MDNFTFIIMFFIGSFVAGLGVVGLIYFFYKKLRIDKYQEQKHRK